MGAGFSVLLVTSSIAHAPLSGQGPSKKAAKHKAAEVALKHLKGGSMLEPALEDSR